MAPKIRLQVWTLFLSVLCVVILSEQSEQPTNAEILQVLVGKLDNLETKVDRLESLLKEIKEGINECLSMNGGCQHLCTDTADSFICSCHPGYHLEEDGKTCNFSAPTDFEEFHGRIIRLPISADTKYAEWDDAMASCSKFGGQPFVPLVKADFDLFKQVMEGLREERLNYMWLPANDRLEEGTLRLPDNGELAPNIEYWDWDEGQELHSNRESYDCLFYGGYKGPVVHMFECWVANIAYAPICEIIRV